MEAGERRGPDVVVLGAEWRERALLRAQLIEEGYDVVAIDGWPMPRLYRASGMQPRLLVVDLRGLSEPRRTLNEIAAVVPPGRILVITALGTLSAKEVRRLGFTTIERPVSVGAIVAAAADALGPAGHHGRTT